MSLIRFVSLAILSTAALGHVDARAASADATMARAEGEVLHADDVDAIRDLAEGYGAARVVELDNGDPAIVGEINGTDYQLFFLECDNGENCGALNFYAVWDVPTVSVGALNVWNRTAPFNKAYLTEQNRPVIEMNLPAKGGFQREQLDYVFEQWTIALAEFARTVIGGAP
ncbi:YbjN domain-containing protein [Fulvimarina sp. 2208YS6-2-32]|uniref:YbjN domain-containing protein n=1 Tax=Fulvimarina uroteuthidis TaxID=3098149 RepID=A0ABU5I2N4_9HYPH|nr:YbjN domain-containing protein [Fulvimarina sp. 2208YS6-2-32]MDY8109619.1 YbjN domain-containing protein [Fulvimarina sp. 2208YS6-2-32]